MDLFNLLELDEFEVEMIENTMDNGRKFKSYIGLPYYLKTFGNLDVIVSTKPDETETKLIINEANTHCSGNFVVDVKCSGRVEYLDKNKMSLVAYGNINESKVISPIHLLNAGIVPSFRNGEILKVQATMMAEDFMVFSSKSQFEKMLNGGKVGSIYMSNADNKISVFSGKVTGISEPKVKINNNEIDSYVVVFIETENGKMSVCCPWSIIKRNKIKNIVSGDYIYGVGILSADLAIYGLNNEFPPINETIIKKLFIESAFSGDFRQVIDHISDSFSCAVAHKHGFKMTYMDFEEPFTFIAKMFSNFDECSVVKYEKDLISIKNNKKTIIKIDFDSNRKISSVTFWS